MYLFVVFQEKESYYRDGPGGKVKARLEEASGERCLVVPYQEFDMRVVEELKPRAIAMSGFGGHFQDRKVKWFYGVDDVLHRAELPMICFCGSHQVIGYCFNSDIRRAKELRDKPMRKLLPGEHAPRRAAASPKYDLSAYFLADGFYPIRRIVADPLFAGLPRTMMMRCSHYCEVKRLPPGFVRIAESDHCRIEAMRHRTRPLWGTQFHPEAYDAPFFHGRTLLRNFARIVDAFWSKKSVPGTDFPRRITLQRRDL